MGRLKPTRFGARSVYNVNIQTKYLHDYYYLNAVKLKYHYFEKMYNSIFDNIKINKPKLRKKIWLFILYKEYIHYNNLISGDIKLFKTILNQIKRNLVIKKKLNPITIIDLLLALLTRKSKQVNNLLNLLQISPNLKSIVRRLQIINDIKPEPEKKIIDSLFNSPHVNKDLLKKLEYERTKTIFKDIDGKELRHAIRYVMNDEHFDIPITNEVREVLLEAFLRIRDKFKHKKLQSIHILLAILKTKNPIIKKLFYPYSLNIKNCIKKIFKVKKNKNFNIKKNKKIKNYAYNNNFKKYIHYFLNILNISNFNKNLKINIIDNFYKLLNKKIEKTSKLVNKPLLNLLDTFNYINKSNKSLKLDRYFEKIQLKNKTLTKNTILSPFKDKFNISWLTYHSLENFDFCDYGYDFYYTKIFKILLKSENKNVILVGENGTGKSIFLKKLAKSFLDNSAVIPTTLKNKLILFINSEFLISKINSLEQLIESFNNLIKISLNEPNLFLFIDNIELYCKDKEENEKNSDISFLEPLLLSNIKCVACTSNIAFDEYFNSNNLFNSKFEKVVFTEPTIQQTQDILKFIRPKLEKQYQIKIPKNILDETCLYSKEYLVETKFPKKAITLLKNAALNISLINSTSNVLTIKLRQQLNIFLIKKNNLNLIQDYLEISIIEDKINVYRSLLKLVLFVQIRQNFLNTHGKKTLKTYDLIKTIIKFTTTNSAQIFATMNIDILKLQNELQKRVVGQDNAIKKIVDAIKRYKIGLKAGNKPIGSFFLAGPTGVGKTEFAKALAKYFFNNENAMLRLDMSEYSQKENVSALIGTPPGYIGYEEGGKLTEFVKINPYSLVLFDEMEKANPNIYDVLLQVLDDGRLTDNRGNTVDFTKTFILFTSNIGVRELENVYSDKNGVEKNIIKPKLNKNLLDYVKSNKTIAKKILSISINSKSTTSKSMIDKSIKFNNVVKILINYGNSIFNKFNYLKFNLDAVRFVNGKKLKYLILKKKIDWPKFEDVINTFDYLSSKKKSTQSSRKNKNLKIKNYYEFLFIYGKAIILKSNFSKLINSEHINTWNLKKGSYKSNLVKNSWLNLRKNNLKTFLTKTKINLLEKNLNYTKSKTNNKINKNREILIENDTEGSDFIKHYNYLLKIVKECLFKRFKPEFINRIDDIIVFERLNKTELKVIVVKLIIDFINNFFNEYGTKLYVDEKFVTLLVEDGYEPKYGARPLKRALNEILVDDLVGFLMKNDIKNYSQLFISLLNKKDSVYSATIKTDYPVIPRLQECQATYISETFSISKKNVLEYLNKKYTNFNNLPY